MEALLEAVEAQCTAIQRTATGSERVVDRLRHGLSVVSDRATRIKRDVDEWEMALRNVRETIVELDEAAGCYQTPRYVDLVVRGESRDPQTVVKALVHLVQSQEYLESKPSNPVGERLLKKVQVNLQRAVKTVEASVHTCVFQAMRPSTLPAGAAPSAAAQANAVARLRGNRDGVPDGPPSRIFKDDWRRRLGQQYTIVEQLAMRFQRLDAARDVAKVVGGRILAHFDELLTLDYKRKYEGQDAETGVAATRDAKGGVVAAMKFLFSNDSSNARLDDPGRNATFSTYRQGDHPFPSFSRDLRELSGEGCRVLNVVVLKAFPTSEDDHRYHRQLSLPEGEALRTDAFEIPSTLILRLCDAVFERGTAAMAHAARSPEVGIHDAIFMALDIVAELWQWRRVAKEAPGETEALIGVVDEKVDETISSASELLGDLQTAKGILDASELVRTLERDEEYGSTKLSPCLLQLIGVHSRELGDAAAAGYSSEEDQGENYSDPGTPRRRAKPVLSRSIRTRWLPSIDGSVHPSTTSLVRFLKHLLGGYQAVLCIVSSGNCAEADTLIAKQRSAKMGQGNGSSWSQPAEEYFDQCVSGHLADIDALADAAAVALNGEGSEESPFAPFSRPLFVANNVHFVVRSLRDDAPFSSTSRNRKACEACIAAYEDRLLIALENYGALWAASLPSSSDDPDLTSAADSQLGELTKSQRVAIKKWFEKASKAIELMCHVTRSHVVAQSVLRTGLSDAAADAISTAFTQFDETVVKGRRWTNREERHLSAPIPEIIASVRSVFGASSATQQRAPTEL
jgi:hypothetical protein